MLADAFNRVQEEVHAAIDGLSPEELAFRPYGQANSIAWLVWHLTRIQDDTITPLTRSAGLDQVWTTGLVRPVSTAARQGGDGVRAHGQPSGVDRWCLRRPVARLFRGYFDADAVHKQTLSFVRALDEAALNRVVDERWTPHVTLGVRLISVISNDLQHTGQAAYVRGLVQRR